MLGVSPGAETAEFPVPIGDRRTPDLGSSHFNLATLLGMFGKTAEAKAVIDQARARGCSASSGKGATRHETAGKRPEGACGAVEAAEAPLDTSRFGWPPHVRGATYLTLGLGAQAAGEFRKIIERNRNLLTSSISHGAGCAYPAAQCGVQAKQESAALGQVSPAGAAHR